MKANKEILLANIFKDEKKVFNALLGFFEGKEKDLKDKLNAEYDGDLKYLNGEISAIHGILIELNDLEKQYKEKTK